MFQENGHLYHELLIAGCCEQLHKAAAGLATCDIPHTTGNGLVATVYLKWFTWIYGKQRQKSDKNQVRYDRIESNIIKHVESKACVTPNDSPSIMKD